MLRRSRGTPGLVVAGVVLTVLVASCSSGDDDTVEPSPTHASTASSLPTTSADPPLDPAPTPTPATLPAETESTTVPAPAPDQSAGGYLEVPADRLLRLGEDGTTHPVEDPLADGVYFSNHYAVTDDGAAVEFELARFTSAEACLESLDTVAVGTVDQSACYGGTVDASATATVSMRRDADVPVILVTADFRFFEVTAAEFARLLDGEPPGADAPPDFEYQPHWATMVEVADGVVVRANQQPSS